MEVIAIVLLTLILVLGSITLMIFLQFLGVARENRGYYQRLMTELNALTKKVSDLSRPEKREDNKAEPQKSEP